MEKEKQMVVVERILRALSPVRTEVVKIEAMKEGVSCADRYLRWLKEKKKCISYTKKGDKTKTWIYLTTTK